jgi:transposase-like protein
MRKNDLKRLADAICGLQASELAAIRDVFDRREREVEAELIETEMAGHIKGCPHCHSKELKSAGSKDGRKRFRCKTCGKSFNGLTGTMLSGLHHADKFLANARHMLDSNTVRKTAAAIGVDASTAFRWRHRFLERISEMQPGQLGGMVEADETYFLESFKGQRDPLPRKAKKRGTPAEKRGLSSEQIPVLVARNRSDGSTLTAVLPSRKGKDIAEVLAPKLAGDSVLLTDGSTAYRAVTKVKKGIELRAVPANPKNKHAGPNHINNVNAYDHRLKDWVEYTFHGVATKYLPNYLGWHRWLESAKGRNKAKKFLADAAKRSKPEGKKP